HTPCRQQDSQRKINHRPHTTHLSKPLIDITTTPSAIIVLGTGARHRRTRHPRPARHTTDGQRKETETETKKERKKERERERERERDKAIAAKKKCNEGKTTNHNNVFKSY